MCGLLAPNSWSLFPHLFFKAWACLGPQQLAHTWPRLPGHVEINNDHQPNERIVCGCQVWLTLSVPCCCCKWLLTPLPLGRGGFSTHFASLWMMHCLNKILPKSQLTEISLKDWDRFITSWMLSNYKSTTHFIPKCLFMSWLCQGTGTRWATHHTQKSLQKNKQSWITLWLETAGADSGTVEPGRHCHLHPRALWGVSLKNKL